MDLIQYCWYTHKRKLGFRFEHTYMSPQEYSHLYTKDWGHWDNPQLLTNNLRCLCSRLWRKSSLHYSWSFHVKREVAHSWISCNKSELGRGKTVCLHKRFNEMPKKWIGLFNRQSLWKLTCKRFVRNTLEQMQ